MVISHQKFSDFFYNHWRIFYATYISICTHETEKRNGISHQLRIATENLFPAITETKKTIFLPREMPDRRRSSRTSPTMAANKLNHRASAVQILGGCQQLHVWTAISGTAWLPLQRKA
jgi:hypothetical protein